MKTQLEMEKLQYENKNSDTGGDGQNPKTNSLEVLIKSVRTITFAIPTKPNRGTYYLLRSTGHLN